LATSRKILESIHGHSLGRAKISDRVGRIDKAAWDIFMTDKVFTSFRSVACLAIGFGLGASCIILGYVQGGARGAIAGTAFACVFFIGNRELQHRERNKDAIIDRNDPEVR
jgi:hypothetical protein